MGRLSQIAYHAGRLLLHAVGAVLIWGLICSQLYSGVPWLNWVVMSLAGLLAVAWFALRVKPPSPPMTFESVRARIQQHNDDAVKPFGQRGRVCDSLVRPNKAG